MGRLFESVYDLQGESAERIRRRAYGVIEVVAGELFRIRLKPWPKLISVAEVNWMGQRTHLHSRPSDQCLLYYNQPRFHRNFLAVKYVVSNLGTTLATFRKTMRVMDEVARIKKADALVCEASNRRISDRLFRRWGWERHLEGSSRRHYIKRFYGVYPPNQVAIATRQSR